MKRKIKICFTKEEYYSLQKELTSLKVKQNLVCESAKVFRTKLKALEEEHLDLCKRKWEIEELMQGYELTTIDQKNPFPKQKIKPKGTGEKEVMKKINSMFGELGISLEELP